MLHLFILAVVDQLQALQSGAHRWNEWRKNNPHTTPDLSGADLRGIQLPGVNLSEANLSDADFSNACMANAQLRYADLSRTNLDQADMSGSDLENAQAIFATLRGTLLEQASLLWTSFRGADLRAANFDGAGLACTLFTDVDLSGAKQLDTCRFWGQVTIDFRTLLRSGQLPVSFLRGCGVPEELIEILPMLFTKPLQHYSVLLKSAEEDREFIERLSSDLRARGIRCWTAPPASLPKSSSQRLMRECFRAYETKLILTVSRHSGRSAWLERDIQVWMQNERLHNRKLLTPICLDDTPFALSDSVVESELKRRVIDFRRWKETKGYSDAIQVLFATLSS